MHPHLTQSCRIPNHSLYKYVIRVSVYTFIYLYTSYSKLHCIDPHIFTLLLTLSGFVYVCSIVKYNSVDVIVSICRRSLVIFIICTSILMISNASRIRCSHTKRLESRSFSFYLNMQCHRFLNSISLTHTQTHRLTVISDLRLLHKMLFGK